LVAIFLGGFMKGKLILENGIEFQGKCFGYLGNSYGEVVFNTGMTGYQEILTDPSYYGQIVVMTYPLIGNYGVNLDDLQSEKVKVKGFVVRELCSSPSNWRNEMSLSSYLKEEKIIGIEGIDTRHLTKLIRNNGTLKGVITTEDVTFEDIKERFSENPTKQAVRAVSRKDVLEIKGTGKRITILDLGVKENIINSFKKRNCNITVMPAYSTYDEIIATNPDSLFLSNGPGDPKELVEIINTVKLIIGKLPIIGICLGHQIISLACGADTEKMKFGHRGSNHPVKNIINQKVTITSQNHGYVVKDNTIPENFEITHINMNDFTIEGIKNEEKKLMCVQFHPEACPGPIESNYIFDDFLSII
jgi:carbamoyl-phosphate synthase small subunit